jgi:hypothetical protein
MKIPSELFTRLRAVFTKPALDADFEAELAQHLEAATADGIRSGMTPVEARRQARIALGGVDQTKELHRDARGLPWLEDLARDVRFALRMLRRCPGFTVIAVLTLALGIGANTAIFSVFHGVLLRPLPYPEQDRLVFIHDWSKETPFDPVSYLNFVAWREQQQSFTTIGVARPWQFSYVGPNETERLNGAVASYDVFAAIGLAPIRGRLFTAEDDKPGAERTVVLRASLWKRLFGGRDSVIGEKIKLAGELHTVIGVLPDDFRVPLEGAELWTPISHSLTGEELQHGYRPGGLYAYARLKPGVSLESAAANMRVLAAGLDKEHPSGGLVPMLLPLATAGAGEVRPILYLLLGAAGFVLLIACANVAGRAFDERDDWQSPRVVIIDTLFADKEFRGRNPIGQHIWTGGTPPQHDADWMEIIGVVGHINTLGPGQPSLPQVHFPIQQTIPQSMGFAVRAEREPVAVAPSLRVALREVADDLSMASVRTMDQLFASNIANQRLVVTLLGAFAALALLLAGVGLYGVVSYSVSQRTREIGIRVALGATSRSVVRMTMQQGATLAGAGLVIGLAAALALTRLLQSLLFETSPHDPGVYAVVAAGLLGVAVLACWLPARRAAKVDPVIALRAE